MMNLLIIITRLNYKQKIFHVVCATASSYSAQQLFYIFKKLSDLIAMIKQNQSKKQPQICQTLDIRYKTEFQIGTA